MLSMRSAYEELLPLFLLLFAFQVNATTMGTYQNFNKVSLASVYDGDTFRVHLACKYGVFCKTIPIRVRGVDCPEIKGGSAETKALAKQAKAFTKNFLKGGKILLRNCGRDKYFRLLCDVKVNGQSLGEELIKAGHAIPYDGGTKTPILSTNN